jgi:phosphoribosylformylglycinamidine synthase
LPGALLHNNSHKFICKNIYLSTQTNRSCITDRVNLDEPLKIPIAHGEGRYFADAEALKYLNDNEQVIFRYCDKDGNITTESNPNGAEENIAGICNAGRNVFGMMPHPERAADKELSNTDGGFIFESIISVLQPV